MKEIIHFSVYLCKNLEGELGPILGRIIIPIMEPIIARLTINYIGKERFERLEKELNNEKITSA